MQSKFNILLSVVLSSAMLFSIENSVYAANVDDAEIEAIVKKVIKENPELILKSVQEYQIKKQEEELSKAKENIIAMQSDIKNNPNSPALGNPKGDVTLVEFFDYHCGHCKNLLNPITKILDSDKNVKVVFKELPIFGGENSALAARAALAVNAVDKTKYFPYHTALMKMTGSFTNDNLTEKAVEIGIDEKEFKKAFASPEVAEEVEHNIELAHSLNIMGTPAIIIGDELIPGEIPLDAIKAKINEARKSDKTTK